MNQAENNGVPRRPKAPAPIILADGTRFFPDDPDAIEETWPNCGPSLSAMPPKSDEVPESLSDELIALINAMSAYKRKRNLEYLLWHDVLDVLHDMGYRKVVAPAPVNDGATS